jgi:adenosylmethionine-8-amino-7-oxononanoate aminotransferase
MARVAADVVSRINYIVPVFDSAERTALVERLKRWTPPGLTRFYFTSGGSEAIETAIKFALLCQKTRGRGTRTKIISRQFSYHGNTLGALSAGHNLRRKDYEAILIDWPKIPASFCYRCPWGKTYPGCDIACANALEAEILKQGPDTVAAFLAEPMMGSAGGSVMPVKEYWPRIVEICRRYDVLLIADEVMTGFGRTGRRFGVDHWDIKPDILVGGKGLTGGYMPMGMVSADAALVEQCERAGADFMFFTYSNHPLACALANKALEIMERERLVERAATIGARMGARLKEDLSGHPMVGDIRGTGMFWSIEMVRERGSKIPYPPDHRVTMRVIDAALEQGLFVYPSRGMAGPAGGDAVMITPPFVIGDDEIGFITRTLRAAFDEVMSSL